MEANLKIIVGGREQIANATLMIPASEDAWVEFDADNWHVKINIVFAETESKADTGVSLNNNGDHAVLTINNWNNRTPMALETPFRIGEVNGKAVECLFSGYAIKSFKRLDISFFWGKRNDK